MDAIYATIEPLLPEPPDHPLGRHRPRVPDRLCFWGVLIRLTTGASWVDIEAILEHRVSDTTLRTRRDEWIAAGVFDQLCPMRSLRSTESSGLTSAKSRSTADCTRPPTAGRAPARIPPIGANTAGKWSIGVDRHDVPLGWAIDGANRNDVRMLQPALDAIAADGWTAEIETSHLDRGYDYPKVGV